MYDITDRREVEDNISDCLHFLKIAFQGLFRRKEHGKAELVLDVINNLKIVLSDIPEPQIVWDTMDAEKEINDCISKQSHRINQSSADNLL